MGAEHKMTRRIQLRRDTGANWTSVDPVLSAGEIGVDLTTGQIKIGDGSGKWSELAYYSGSDVDLTEYATKEYVDDAVGAIEIPDVSNFITADDIPTIPQDISDLTDTENLLGSGSADTGDITFDGVKVIGAGTASGDGNGYATLELVPDNDLYDNDQYLVVDPTAPSHIHIRAGGAQDDSNAELYLGGEKNYVRVTDGNGVRLYNESLNVDTEYYLDGAQFTSAAWTAGAEGQPSTVSFTSTDQNFTDIILNSFFNDDRNVLQIVTTEGTFTLTSTGFGSIGEGLWRFNVNEIPAPSPQTVSEIILTIWTTRENSLSLSNNDFTVTVTDDVRITGSDTFSLRNTSTNEPITIRTNYDGDDDHVWRFGADGDLTLAGGGLLGQVWGDGADNELTLKSPTAGGASAYVALSSANEQNYVEVSNGGVVLAVNFNTEGLEKWTFDTTGNLTVAGNINFGGDASSAPSLNDFAGVTSAANFAVTIDSADSALTWSFEAGDSALGEFDESPILRTPAGAGSVIYNETLMAILAGNIDAGERSSVRLLEGGVSLLGTTSLDGELSTIIMEVNTGGVGIRALGDAAPRLSVTGNITGGNILTSGSITANGNVTAQTFIGNISANGLTFSDSTVQTTAWSGGRVVDAPASSTGAEGDKAGDLAFSTGHIYYCFEDYDTGVSYNTTLSNITETDNKFIFAKNEGIIEPEIGWSITVDVGGENEETHTITLVEDLATDWRVTWSGGNVTFDPGTAIRVFSTNIWKRVAWSNDVW